MPAEASVWARLRFSAPNEKMRKTGKALGTNIRSFNLPALKSAEGFTVCHGAGVCASLCFARQGWYHRPSVAALREDNLAILRGMSKHAMIWALDQKLLRMDSNVGIIRLHDSGDFYSKEYLDAWLAVMMMHPRRTFYAYTKMIPLFVKDGKVRELPKNFVLVFSEGGKWDSLIPTGAPRSRIFVSHEEREAAGFVDGTSTDGDLPVLQRESRIGLCYHGQRALRPWQKKQLRAAV